MPTVKLRILVTGASGFLGRNILRALAGQARLSAVAACRDKTRLPAFFQGEVREGDLRDPAYRRSVVKDIDMICHAGTWAAMWGHAAQEQDYFFIPTIDLIEQAIGAGVKRFLMTSTVAIGEVRRDGTMADDFSRPAYTGFWPHLDRLIDVDAYMQANAGRGMQMLNLRLGHFVGAGNKLGLVPALVPRLRTRLVPWLAGGKGRLPLVADTDLAQGFVAALLADGLQDYESFNICGPGFPTSREVINYVATQAGVPTPLFSVPYPLAYLFGGLMERLFPVLPGKAPFLTRSIIHLAEDWLCSTDYARAKLGYVPQKDWQTALDEALAELKSQHYPWPQLVQRNRK